MSMPDNLDTKKEIDEFYKNAMKELAVLKKMNKKEVVKPDVKPKKAPKKNLDENGDEKPKRPLTAYQIFLKKMQPKMKEEHPELSNTERFTKIAEEWQKHKATLAGPTDSEDDTKSRIDSTKESSDEEVLPTIEPVVDDVVVKPAPGVEEITLASDEEDAKPVEKKPNMGAPRKALSNKPRKAIGKKAVEKGGE